MKTVFEKIDAQKRSFLGFNPVAVLWNVTNWRKYFAFCAICGAVAWAVFGFDSTWSMLKPFGDNLVQLLTGKISLRSVWELSRAYYGMGNHFSAPVIYGIAFVTLSFHLEKVGITKSLNFCSTTALSLMSVGAFELIWNSCYAHFHGQTWVVAFKWKQVTNLCSFIAFTFIGLLVFLYLAIDGYRPNLSKTSLILFILTVGCWVFWINYPLPVGHITVETTAGPWTNSNMFPQTYYCVDVRPDDNIAIGVPNHVEDNMVHFVNTLTKIVQTIFVLNICRVKRTEGSSV